MRSLLHATALCALALVGSATYETVQASTSTATITVTATVLSFCTISAAPLAFGNYSTAQANTTSLLTISCTTGTTYTIGLDAGAGSGATFATRLMGGTTAGSTLGYSIYSDAGRTTVWGNTIGTDTVAGTGTGLPQQLTAYGSIPAGQLSAPGLYTDTVTATLTY